MHTPELHREEIELGLKHHLPLVSEGFKSPLFCRHRSPARSKDTPPTPTILKTHFKKVLRSKADRK